MTRARDLADSADKDISGTLVLDDITLSNDISIADNGKAIFGAGSDLQIYHDGQHSYVSDQGTGNIKVLADDFVLKNSADTANMIVALTGGAATLYHDGDTRLATTSIGIDVTGTVTADGLTVENASDATITLTDTTNTCSTVLESRNTTASVGTSTAHDFQIRTDDTQRIRLDSNGDISFYEDTGTAAKLTWSASNESLDIDGTTTSNQYLLDSIDKDIADTAVDVFVYDTSKDSDGGAWRKRTQGTSWYNETLNTATRGSRKEFPAVAVIVAESNQVTIYDGDDPDLPMWMVFNEGGSQNNSNMLNGVAAVSALNATLVISGFALTISFLKDSARAYRDSSGALYWNGPYNGNIAERNSLKGWTKVGSPLLVNGTVNDVAMTVLPNAPIDAATGLPVPTIAVATNGGTSIIRDDGTVVDLTYTNFNAHGGVAFVDGNLLITNDSGSTNNRFNKVHTIPTSDISAGNYQGGQSSTEVVTFTGDRVLYNHDFSYSYSNTNYTTDGRRLADNAKAFGHTGGFVQYDGTRTTGVMFNNATSSFSTGYQVGAIKLATLSDTDDTDVTGSELVTNGTFDTDVSGWSTPVSGYTTFTWSSGTLQHAASGGTGRVRSPAIAVVAGKTYTFSVEVTAKTADSGSFVHLGTSAGASNIKNNITQGEAVGTSAHTFTATTSSVFIELGAISGNTVNYDNVSLRLAEEDRSVNGNGLQVFGTVTKNPVATGADLVAYSGFSTSNYLEQPYNSDLDFGTGDCCGMAWFKHSDTALTRTIFDRDSATSDKAISFEIAATNSYLQISLDDGTDRVYVNSGVAVDNDVWHLGVWVRRGNTLELYLDGVLKNTGDVSSVDSISSTDARLRIGDYRRSALSLPFGGDIALVRLSATAPSPEQIAKIYEDEKVLFQENAQATLYGDSDAVTALAYDDTTELLHVGTSAGRSDFQGLRRVNNTTNAVGAAISASNGMIVEE